MLSQLTPLEIAAWSSFAVVVIGAIGSVVINIITALGIIEGKVDGAASVSVAKISSLQDNVTSLHGIIAKDSQVAAVLAANQSSTDQVKAANEVKQI